MSVTNTPKTKDQAVAWLETQRGKDPLQSLDCTSAVEDLVAEFRSELKMPLKVHPDSYYSDNELAANMFEFVEAKCTRFLDAFDECKQFQACERLLGRQEAYVTLHGIKMSDIPTTAEV